MPNTNTNCSVCGNGVYQRPSQMGKHRPYCSEQCRMSVRGQKIVCANSACGRSFRPTNRRSRCCSRSCANTLRRGMKYGAGRRTDTRTAILVSLFGRYQCMIEGCDYTTTLDTHRVLPGREGGKYEVGNMFLICPNHHAEIERGYTHITVVNDHTLRIDNPTAGDGTIFEKWRSPKT